MSIRVVTDSSCDLPQSLVDALAHRDRPAHDPLRRRGARRPRGAQHRRVLAPARALDKLCPRPRRRRPARSRPSSASSWHAARPASCASTCRRTCRPRCRPPRSRRPRSPATCPVQVIDSQSASMGLGNLCLTAARRAADGDSLESIVTEVVNRRDRTKLFATLDTLEFLQARGRVGNARALLGIDAVDQADHRDRARASSRRRARSAPGRRRSRCSRRRRRRGRSSTSRCCTATRPTSTSCSTCSSPIFPRDEIITGVVGPVIGTHAGPRVIGVTFQVVR